MSIRVTAPTRLHFGLFHVPADGGTHWPDGRPVRSFGGLGLMLREPAVRVTLARRNEWQAAGSLADRALAFARQAWDGPGLKVVAQGPPEHVGLGVGTALGLAVAAGCARLAGRANDVRTLAARVGRGRRSGVGMYGFAAGGFLVDDGRLGDEPPQLRQRLTFPKSWGIMLVRTPAAGAWHGGRERSAFGRSRSAAVALDTTRRLMRLADEVIIPAIRHQSLPAFADSIADFNRIAGEPFQADQGGAYAGRAITEVIEAVRSEGGVGVGQSSWGPTVFSFEPTVESAEELAGRVRLALPAADVIVSAADNRGAILNDEQSDEANE